MSTGAPIIVVGGGIAGLSAALAAAPAPVLLLTRRPGALGAASTLAQGGIAAALAAGDSPAAHALDTCVAGSHHNDVAMVDLLTTSAPAAIDWLQAIGVAFDRDPDGHLQLGREGGHDRPRIAHAGGDGTGAAVMRALVAAARAEPRIRRVAGCDVDALALRDGRVVGVSATLDDGRQQRFDGHAVVLALAAGPAARDLEFVQFHPTALAVPGLHTLPLVTEALRGAGARLLDPDGRPLMAGVHPLGDLAPRDIVARRVAAAVGDGGAWLDARHLGAAWPTAFPTVLAACLAHAIDPRLQPIPVTPAAHFHMGGVATDADGRTSLPGLFATGEVACNGVHGANRLASNSLLEGVVFGRRLGHWLAAGPEAPTTGGEVAWVGHGPSLTLPALQRLRMLMGAAMGPVRNADALQAALCKCDALAAEGWQAGLARLMLAAALQRRHSLGAHYRDDDASMAGPGTAA